MSKIFDDLNKWFSGTNRKTTKSKTPAGSGGGSQSRRSANKLITKAVKIQKTTNAIKAVNNKVPQVIVKISGSSKGVDKAQAHADYVGRNGEVELEDQDGNKYKGKEQQKDVLGSWKAQGMHETHNTGTKREAFNFVFSMPKGTNPEAMKEAVKNLVREEFDGHKYVLAQHLDTDSPHVHVIVNATNDRGERLNPRKQDLHNYRVNFVEKLREQGIAATATRRIHQFKYREGYRQSELHSSKRAGQGVPRKREPNKKEMKSIEQTHESISQQYRDYAQSLTGDHRELKREIDKLVKSKSKLKDKEQGR